MHLEKPVSPKHARYPKVVQTARHIAERSPVQKECIVFPIYYEGPSVCLQRERRCSAGVWRRGNGRLPRVGEMELGLPRVLLFSLCLPTPDLIRSHSRLVQSSCLTWGSSSVRSSSSRERRQSGFLGAMALSLRSNCHVADSWEGTSVSKAGRRPPQVARQTFVLGSSTSL